MKNINCRGLTITEMLILIVIVGIAFPMIFKGIYTAHIKQIDTHRVQDFAYLLKEKMDSCLAAGYNEVPDLTLAGVNPETMTGNFATYQRTVYVSYVTANYASSGVPTEYRQAIVRVTHTPSGAAYLASTYLRRRN